MSSFCPKKSSGAGPVLHGLLDKNNLNIPFFVTYCALFVERSNMQKFVTVNLSIHTCRGVKCALLKGKNRVADY